MTKDEALKLSMEAMEITGGFDVEINAIKEALADTSPNFNCKSVQARLATAWGYVKAQPEQEQLMSDQMNYGMSVTQGGKRIDPMSIYKEPEQEPVTWRYKIVDVFGRPVWTLKTPRSDTRVLESQPLYTTPPQRKPLTEAEIIDKTRWFCVDMRWPSTVLDIARAIEAAHGIKELV